MKAALFILVYVAFYIPSAFSDSLSPSQVKGKWPSTPAKDELQPDWAGFHTGVILGAQWGKSRDKTDAFGYNADNDKWDYRESGVNAGAEWGYNVLWQQLVIGPEIELGYLNLRGSGAQPASPAFDTVGKSSSNFYTAFRGRLGVDLNRYLVFATGGVMGVNYKTQVIDRCNIAPCGGGTVQAQKSDFVWGYTVGAGIERMFKKEWSGKLECLYYNLNTQRFSGTTNLGTTYDWTGQTAGYIIRGGFNYYF